jgi:hypothetical protein
MILTDTVAGKSGEATHVDARYFPHPVATLQFGKQSSASTPSALKSAAGDAYIAPYRQIISNKP